MNLLGIRQLILRISLLPQASGTRQTHTLQFPISPPLYMAPNLRCALYLPPPSSLHAHSACHDCLGVCMYVLTRVLGPPTVVTRLGSPASPHIVPVDAAEREREGNRKKREREREKTEREYACHFEASHFSSFLVVNRRPPVVNSRRHNRLSIRLNDLMMMMIMLFIVLF